ncbi:hypothetical protein [Caldalkalibacillus mannanilyticus]|uniref:hypothetical protein n=1 Tax=Caldalkalibacillus mannanilyticus TaxID=1418 RepID=UPI0004693EAC|nr:hypothetical protein [Caldalkalibacillus mannanilyticus]
MIKKGVKEVGSFFGTVLFIVLFLFLLLGSIGLGENNAIPLSLFEILFSIITIGIICTLHTIYFHLLEQLKKSFYIIFWIAMNILLIGAILFVLISGFTGFDSILFIRLFGIGAIVLTTFQCVRSLRKNKYIKGNA